jgi:uncharacterized protein YukE
LLNKKLALPKLLKKVPPDMSPKPNLLPHCQAFFFFFFLFSTMTSLAEATLRQTIDNLSLENNKLVNNYVQLTAQLEAVKAENAELRKESTTTAQTITELREKTDVLQQALAKSQLELSTFQERQTTILAELNRLKEAVMDSNNLMKSNDDVPSTDTVGSSDALAILSMGVGSASMRSIPAPSKVMLEDQKKKDNRLVELKRITKEFMNINDQEANLRLYKLQKTMIHVVADLKKYMQERNEDISKSWKSIELSTQRVAFDMVETEAVSLGVPLNMCIGYWGARRLISKSWANALRTTKKHIKSPSSKLR